MAGLLDQIIGVESGGDPNAKNHRSSATGLGQFIESTWLDMLARHRPDIKGTREELLELRKDPALSRAMTDAYASDNSAVLSKAGLPVNPANTYLSHFAGPQGAVDVLKADPNTSVEAVLGSRVVAANPFLKGMTAGDLTAWAGRKMGAQPAAPVQQPVTQPVPASPVGPLQAIPAMSFLPSHPAQAAQTQQAQPQPTMFEQMPAEQMGQPPPIFAPPRKPIDLRALRAALARPPGGFFNARRG